jgi:cytochrome P450
MRGPGVRPGASRPPGPPGRVLLGSLPDFRRDPLAFLLGCARTYGDVVRFRLGGWETWLVSDPALVGEVLTASEDRFAKHRFFWRHVRAVFGQGLLTSDGDLWRRQRRTIQPAFSRSRIAAYADAMVACAERHAEAWAPGEPCDVHREMTAIALEIVAAALFAADVAADVEAVGAAFAVVTAEVTERFTSLVSLPVWVPTPANRRYASAVRRLDAVVARMIAAHEAGGPGDDLLSTLLRLEEADGGRMSARQVRDEVVGLFIAGHETTAVALTWTWVLLARHPEADARLAAELAAVLGGRSPSAADVPRLAWTSCVVREAIRLYPPAWVIGREAVVDGRLGGYPLAAGTTILVSPWVVHRRPDCFADPERFRPERWEGAAARAVPAHAYLPFGAGQRQCVGASFAEMEAMLVLATIAQRRRLVLAPGTPDPAPTASITLRPSRGVPMIAAPRVVPVSRGGA